MGQKHKGGKMAKHEACELYIEQQIKEGLEKGETPYYIGKTLSDWISELFDAKINPKTLKKRAERQKKKLVTNVTKESESAEKTDTYEIPKLTDHKGGKRDGAGRPPKETDKATCSNDHPIWEDSKEELRIEELKEEPKLIEMSGELKKAYDFYFNQVKLVKSSNWETASKEVVLKAILDIIEFIH